MPDFKKLVDYIYFCYIYLFASGFLIQTEIVSLTMETSMGANISLKYYNESFWDT